jgi:endonuclease YncB( thermonuclease family)
MRSYRIAYFAAFSVILLNCAVCAERLDTGDVRATRPSRSHARASTANCQLESGGESTVLAVSGPQTLRLADGRFVRLAEILIPTQAHPASGFDPAAAAMEYLRKASVGQKVAVKFGGTQRDRYGVAIAHVFVEGEQKLWMQQGLVSAGLAQAYIQPDNHACAETLIEAEASAREAKRGLWGLAYFKVLPARDHRAILNLVQTYQIVEGQVLSVAESGGRLFLNFGEDQKRGFSAVVESSARKKFSSKREAQSWIGAFVRIRGWIDRKRGPVISVAQAEQVEFLPQNGDLPK